MNMTAPNTPLPPVNAAVVIPADATVFECSLITFYAAAAANIAVLTAGGQTLTFVGVQPGSTLPVLCCSVLATGTTAAANSTYRSW